MSSLLEEIRELDETNRWNPTFQLINLETRKIADKKTVNHARQPHNRSLNRYRDVLPYDDTRVTLKSDQNDYINANYVEVSEVNRKYILTQGPLAHTCKDFWLMIWENESKGIIMLNRIVEKNMMKCHPYWPMGENEVASYGDFEIRNKSTIEENSYIIRELHITNLATDKSRLVYQYHFMLWPDFGVPQEPASFIKFLESIRKSGILDPNCPPVIHCSAGIGRSGTFILVDVALAKAEKDKSPDLVKPKDLLLKMREYRLGLIQTAEQYRFANLLILYGFHDMFPELFQDDLNSIEDNNDGEPPPLPPRHFKDTTPPAKPQRIIETSPLIDSSSDDEDVEEEVINLSASDVSDDDYNNVDTSEKHDTEKKNDDYEPVSKTPRQENHVNTSSNKTIENNIKPTNNQVTEDRDTLVTKNVNKEKTSQTVEVKTGVKASANEPQLRNRQQKLEKTKAMVDNIKRKMKESEESGSYTKPFLYVGLAVTICVGVFTVYRYFS